MDMDKLGKQEETLEWFLDHLDEDEQGWLATKRKAYDDGAGLMLDGVIHQLAGVDEEIAHVYANLDEEHRWQLFLAAFPDEKRMPEDPGWYWYEPNYHYSTAARGEQGEVDEWRVGFEWDSPAGRPEKAWKITLQDTAKYLATADWFINLLRNWHRRPPEGHPEFEFESQENSDLDAPEPYIKALDPTKSLRLGCVIERHFLELPDPPRFVGPLRPAPSALSDQIPGLGAPKQMRRSLDVDVEHPKTYLVTSPGRELGRSGQDARKFLHTRHLA
jgi:hypothetical protein